MGISWSNKHNVEEKIKYVYGWKRDLPDKRDHYHCFKNIVKKDLPECLDLRNKCPPVYNQGCLGCSTANAIAAAYTFCENKLNPSRLFIYYNERKIEGLSETYSGTMIRNSMKSIYIYGACHENMWPYNISTFTNKPTSKCYIEAKNHRAICYKRLPQSITAMKACLNNGLPFVFGFTVYESFETKEVEETGIMSMPNENEKILGGHAVLAVGYCNKKNCFIIRNSWGEEWGEGGYFYMPYKFIRDSNYCSDFWTLNKIKDISDDGNKEIIKLNDQKDEISNDTNLELIEDKVPQDQ
jgi:C1A family cysteine protease